MTGSENKTEVLPNLTVDGVCNAGGGFYDSVNLDGVGKVTGAVKSRTFRANGQFKVLGNLDTTEMICEGILTVRGDAHVAEGKIDGMLTIEGKLGGEHLEVYGVWKVKKDCEIESIKTEGAFFIDGLLNAGQVQIHLHGLSKAGEIGVEALRVRRLSKSKWNLLRLIPKFNPELQAKVIEGDELDLEYTTAEVVRGNRVTIGPGCNIGRVEYRAELIKHPKAKVGEEMKLGG